MDKDKIGPIDIYDIDSEILSFHKHGEKVLETTDDGLKVYFETICPRCYRPTNVTYVRKDGVWCELCENDLK